MSKKLNTSLSNLKNYNLNDYSLAIFGAGNTALLYQKCFQMENINPLYYIDNNPTKQGNLFQNIEVCSLDKFLNKSLDKPKLILICSANIDFCNQIKKELKNCTCEYITVDEYVFQKHQDDILKVSDLLDDEFSKTVYAEMIIARIQNCDIPEYIISPNQYFCLKEFLDRNPHEVFVDLGAYVGDSIEQYINIKSGVFANIFAFEPEINNYNAMICRIERLQKEWALSEDKIIAVNGAMGVTNMKEKISSPNSKKGSPNLGANLLTSNDNNDDNKNYINIFSLNHYFKNQKVSFIKADIESFEYETLIGGKEIIQKDNPLLAICIYHNASDMYTIPLLIKSLNPNYKLKIRHHTLCVYIKTVVKLFNSTTVFLINFVHIEL